jgi:hypothetical protein
MSNFSSERQAELRSRMRQMLGRLSIATPRKLYCEDCGSFLEYVNAHIWFSDSGESWEVPLPYCRECNPEFRSQASFQA